MNESWLTVNAMEIAPVEEEMEIYHSDTPFKGSIECRDTNIPKDWPIELGKGYINFQKADSTLTKYLVKMGSAPSALVMQYLTFCLSKEFMQNQNVLVGNVDMDSLEICTPASKMQTIYSNPYYRFRLQIKFHKDRYLLWIRYEDTLQVSVLNMFEAANTMEPTKFKRFRVNNRILDYDQLQEGIIGSQLFPVHPSSLAWGNEQGRNLNPYIEQWNQLLQFCHQYLLQLTSIQFTGKASLFEQFPTIKPPICEKQTPCIKNGMTFVYVSVICKTNKKRLTFKKMKSLLDTLNMVCDEACFPLLFHYHEEANILLRENPSKVMLQNAFQKLKVDDKIRHLYILDGSLSKVSIGILTKELDKRKLRWLHTQYNAPHFKLLHTDEINAQARKMLMLFRPPSPMQKDVNHLILSLSDVSINDIQYVGISCCFTWEGIHKEQETIHIDQLDKLVSKVNYLLTLCKIEGHQPEALSFHLNTNILPETREKIKIILAKMPTGLPFYFLEITAPDKNSYLAFELSSMDKHPGGSYICELESDSYLVYLKDKLYNQKHPLPLHINLSKQGCSNLTNLEIQTSLKQVIQFSHLFVLEEGIHAPYSLIDISKQRLNFDR